MEVIRDSQGNVISQSRNLRGIRAYVGKHEIKVLSIYRIGQGEGKLMILFANGNSFECGFASYLVLKWFVRNWRNAHGAPFRVGGINMGCLKRGHAELMD